MNKILNCFSCEFIELKTSGNNFEKCSVLDRKIEDETTFNILYVLIGGKEPKHEPEEYGLLHLISQYIENHNE